MYKVMFVDDEEQNLFLMEKIIDWEDYGFRVSGIALDGTESFKMYEEILPDLMFVDIRMEEIDGLSLIQKIKEVHPETNTIFVIVTAYEEFEYAKRAIQLGVENYILKPLDRTELAELVLSIQKKLDKNMGHKMLIQLKAEQQENYKFEKTITQMEKDLLKNEKIKAFHYELNEVIKDREYVLLNIFSPNVTVKELQEKIDQWDVKYCNQSFDSIFFIIPAEKLDFVKEWFRKECMRCSQKKYILQINESFLDEESFIASFIGAFQSRHSCFYAKESQIFSSKAACINQVFSEKQTLEIRTDEIIKELLYTGNPQKLKTEILRIIEKAAKKRIEPDRLIGSMIDILLQLKYQLTQVYKDRAFMLLRHLNVWEFHKIHMSQRLCTEMEQVLTGIGKSVEQMIENKENYSMMGKIMEFIDSNYTRSDFSATEAAKEVSLSKNYFLKIFKEENEISFWDYVTKLRMNRAKELLKNTKETIYAISLEVGYESQYHFSRKFKSLFQVSPIEYRNL